MAVGEGVAGLSVTSMTPLYPLTGRPNRPVPVTFLPTFWLPVPGALGPQGVTRIVGADQAAGLGDFFDALLSIVAIVAIVVGVVVGSGLAERLGLATSTWRGV